MISVADERDVQLRTAGIGAERFVRRCLDVFFSRWFLFLLPAVIIAAFGVYTATTAQSKYKSVGVLSVSKLTYLEQLTAARPSAVSYDTAATVTARSLNDLLGTDGFTTRVIDAAGMSEDLKSGRLQLVDVRHVVYARPSGENLMQVVAQGDTPESAYLLAKATIATFVDYVTKSEITASDSAESFYNDLANSYKTAVDQASNALNDYLGQHPKPVGTQERDISESVLIQRLSNDLDNAQGQLKDASTKQETARLASAQTQTDISQRYQLLDAPRPPQAPESGLKAKVITIGMFAVIGGILTLGAVALLTVFDRSVHTAEDLEEVGLAVAAIVPRSKRVRLSGPPRSSVELVAKNHSPVRAAG